MPRRAPEFRAVDCAAFDAMSSARPRKPPPFAFAPRRLTAGQLEAHRYNARAGRLSGPLQADDAEAEQGDSLTLVNPR